MHLGRKASGILATALLCLLVVAASARTGASTSVTIPADDIHVESKVASAGSRLTWSWSSSAKVVFSVSGATNETSVLYRKESFTDAGSTTLPRDGTYFLLWLNENSQEVNVTYTVTVEPGEVSMAVIAFVLVLFVVCVAAVALYLRRKPAAEPEGLAKTREAPGIPKPPAAPPDLPPPTPEIDRAPAPVFCPHCGSRIARPGKFCEHCGGRLMQL